MARIYIIAGAPGIGKSTAGAYFVPKGIHILDADLMGQLHRKQGYPDYREMGEFRFQELLRKELLSGKDFAFELNLGFESHYDLLRSVRSFNPENEIHLVLFHTDSPELCVQRARIRYACGLHLVPEATVREMYANIMPLLQQNIRLFSGILALHVDPQEICPQACACFSQTAGWKDRETGLPAWVSGELISLLNASVAG